MKAFRYLMPPFVATALILVAGPATAAPRPDSRSPGVCQHRACVLVLDATYDTDGDGVSDVDEIAFNTDANSPRSHPLAQDVIDRLLERRLPSYERHLTEAVVLPQLTPDGHSFATGLGRFAIPDRAQADSLVASLTDALTQLHGNQLDLSLGMQTSASTRDPAVAGLLGGAFGWVVISDGKVGGAVSFGANSGKLGRLESGSVFSWSDGASTHSYAVTYEDGSHDQVSSMTAEKDFSIGEVNNTQATSYSTPGTADKSSFTEVSSSTTVHGDGSVTTGFTATTTYYDDDGNVTGTAYVSAEVTTGNGETWITFTTETTDADGKVTSRFEETYHCQTTACSEKYVDPDYVQFVLSPADTERAMAKLNSTRRPGPDTGELGPLTPTTQGPLDPTVALFNPDGVTVYAVGTSPSFNRTSPDYDPRLGELSEFSGVPIPKPNYS